MGNNTVKLTITMSPNGGISVTGPIDNVMLCYGLLEAAKDVIRRRIEKQAESGLVPVQILLPGNGRI